MSLENCGVEAEALRTLGESAELFFFFGAAAGRLSPSRPLIAAA